MDLGLKERVAIVTGGSSGIGEAIASVLAAQGATVVITARRPDKLTHAAEQMRAKTGGTVVPISSDTTDQGKVDSLVEKVDAEFGRIDILVNCAADSTGLVHNDIRQFEGSALLKDLDTKVVGYARCAKAVAPVMIRNQWGRIINIGGLTGRGYATVLSGMRNAAISHLTKILSDQLGPHGITVNILHPGIIRTELTEQYFAGEAAKRGVSIQAIEAEISADTPIRRIILPEEIGNVVAFLSSPLAGAITGESLAIDGGITRGVFL